MLRSTLLTLALLALALSLRVLPASAEELPEGEGLQQVHQYCSECHPARLIAYRQGYDTEAEWRSLFDTMVALPANDAEVIARYLRQHFPHKSEYVPTLVPGDFVIAIEEWQVPKLGQRSRDPVEAPDGSIWWTGMWASLVGRLDPTTGEMLEFPLPPSARPHSIVPSADGMIWYTGNSNATLGRLNPEDGSITEYPTQAPDPHTAVFHPNGKLYFTAQHAGMLGRLDPKTGELLEVETRERPYGIKVASTGKLYVAYNGTNAIGEVDPDTLAVRYFDIPNAASRIRRLDIASDDSIWYVNSSRGRLGHLNPITGQVREWPSPSGPSSHPYAIAVIDDVVWYNESGMRPDALVRFDPISERFQSWAIPSGIGIVRHVWVTQEGDLLIHQTSSNRIGRVRIPKRDTSAVNPDR